MTRCLVLIVLIPCVLGVSPAHADMRLGVQNDDQLVLAGHEGGVRYLERADELGATWVRMMVPDTRWNDQAGEYVRAAQQAHADGKHVMVSLLAWQTAPTPRQWAAYARDVVGRMAPYVDAWSPMNEPNWFGTGAGGMNPRLNVRCVAISSPSVTAVQIGRRAARGWKKVRRGRGRYRRRIARRDGQTVVRFKRAQTRHQRKRARWKRTLRHARPTTVLVATAKQRHECATEAVGAAYRRVWDAVAPVFAQDAGASIVVGDVSGRVDVFIDAFYADGAPAVRPDVLGCHPYEGATGARECVRVARERSLPAWATEWSLHRADATPERWVDELRAFDAAGIGLTMIYDTKSPQHSGWDTQMRPDDLAAVARYRSA